MEQQKIEYIRKNGRKKGRKKGVLFCGVDPDNPDSVMVGFTLCHPIDDFDYIKGQRVPGFGLDTAKTRADKLKQHCNYFIQKTFTEEEIDAHVCGEMKIFKYINPDNRSIVEIPPSVEKNLVSFIERCKKYYKDKTFPEWVENVLIKNSYDTSYLQKEEIYR